MLMLSAHYRSPLNFSRDMMAQAHASKTRLGTAKEKLLHLLRAAGEKAPKTKDEKALRAIEDIEGRFIAGMDNDFNTAEAMGALFELVYFINTELDEKTPETTLKATMEAMDMMTGIFGLLTKSEEEIPEEVRLLAIKRAQARKDRDWARSDTLRGEMADLGWSAEDTPQGQKLRRT
jgi:cysteinyl-tRNA synthetase